MYTLTILSHLIICFFLLILCILYTPPHRLLSLLLVCFLLVLIHLFVYPGHSVLDTVIDNILDLEFIFMISMMFSQMPEFL